MKKEGKSLIKDLVPELKDTETADKLDQITKLGDKAKEHDKLLKEVKETLKGFVLGLPKSDQEIGRVKVGDYILPFTIMDTEETPVSFTRKAGKKVTISFSQDEDEQE